jgi:hypothetical protein
MAAMFKTPALPTAPTPIKPPALPDLNSPQALAMKQKQMAAATAGGRTSTMLTTGAGTIAGGATPAYSGRTLGG